MPKYITHMCYSTGSWARMINNPGDRHAALEHIVEALGGSFISLYWELGSQDSLLIADLPDSVSAGALTTVITKTGAFKAVDTHQLLTQKQLLEMLALAKDTADVFEVPGEQGCGPWS
jgi:uncharacterized protein with GYD domain